MVPQSLRVHVAVSGKERPQLVGAVGRGPAGEIAGSARQVQGRERPVVVRECRRAIGEKVREVGAHPVEHRHEVVAQHRNAERAHGAHALAIGGDESVAAGAAELDVFVYRNALDHGEREAHRIDLRFEALQSLATPDGAHRHVVQRAHDPGDARDVPDVG